MSVELQNKVMSIIESNKETTNCFGFTTDIWTTRTFYSYLSLTVHFVTSDFQLCKVVPFVSYFGRMQHTGQNICLQLEDLIKELGLDSDNITKYIVLDNAANNVKAMELTKMFEAIPCSIHTLQLAVCDSFKASIQLKKVSDVLKKNNKLVNFVRRSEARLNELKDACKAVNITFIIPVKPNDTRWNSEFSSLMSTIHLNRGYKYLAFNDNSKKKIWLEHVLNNDEMSIVVATKNALDPVKNASKLWEGDLVPTIHLVVRELFNIRDKLSEQSKDSDEYVAEFATELAAQVEM